MSSGLTRRRGAAGPSDGNGDEGNSSRVQSPAPRPQGSGQPETSYESGVNGHKIAFDPRDMNESAERSKQPKLTMMEEVLLLGLKDKQVSPGQATVKVLEDMGQSLMVANRDTSLSGTTTYHMRLEDV